MSVAWVFPGQGSHSIGMASAWAAASASAVEALRTADDVLDRALSALIADGPLESLSDTRNQQPALLATSVAILEAAADRLPAPSFVAGHSVGEFAACVAAGSLTYPAALELVGARAELMHAAGERHPGRVAAVLGLSDGEVEALVERIRGAEIANYNAPGQVVISGTRDGIDEATRHLVEAGARRVIPLDITVAVHSSLMREAGEAFAERLENVEIASPHVPIVGNVSARALGDAEAVRQELRQQLTSSVRWTASVETMLDGGVRHFIEIGPGAVLGGLIKRIARERGAEDLHIESYAAPPGSA